MSTSRLAALALTTVLSVTPFACALAFWSYGLPFDSTHQNITKSALQSQFRVPYYDVWLPFSPAAIVAINRVHREIDDPDFYNKADHFDDEEMELSRRVIQERRDVLLRHLATSNPSQTRAWELLGQILHATQDFYSHSTWRHSGAGITFDLTAKTRTITAEMFPAPSEQVCLDDAGNNVVSLPPLATGYYFGIPARQKTCRHGAWEKTVTDCALGLVLPFRGLLASRDGINLDTFVCTDIVTMGLAYGAYKLARNESADLVQDIIQDLSATNNYAGICILMGHAPVTCGASNSPEPEIIPPPITQPPADRQVRILSESGRVGSYFVQSLSCPWFSSTAASNSKGEPYEMEYTIDDPGKDLDPSPYVDQYKQAGWVRFSSAGINFTSRANVTILVRLNQPTKDGGLIDQWSYTATAGPLRLYRSTTVAAMGDTPQLDVRPNCPMPPSIAWWGGYGPDVSSSTSNQIRCGGTTLYLIGEAASEIRPPAEPSC